MPRRTKTRGNGTGCAYWDPVHRYWIAQVIVDWRVSAEDKPLVPVKKTKGGFKTRDKALSTARSSRRSTTAPQPRI